MKRLLSNITVLNVLLILIIGLFAYYTYYSTIFSISSFALNLPDTKQGDTSKDEQEEADNEEITKQQSQPQTLDYTIIAEKNLFHPERRIPPEKKPVVELPKPEFILYGTLITDGEKIAYLEDKKSPVTTPGRGKRQSALKIGQSMAGFTLKEIMPDHVVMTRNEETLVVQVIDPKNKSRYSGSVKKSDKENKQQPTKNTPQHNTLEQTETRNLGENRIDRRTEIMQRRQDSRLGGQGRGN